jgi:hypothetical protein
LGSITTVVLKKHPVKNKSRRGSITTVVLKKHPLKNKSRLGFNHDGFQRGLRLASVFARVDQKNLIDY